MELQDLSGLTFLKWCVGGDFNVIRRTSEKLGGSRVTPSMRDCELIDPPLRNASFTWSNLQKKKTLFAKDWIESFFLLVRSLISLTLSKKHSPD